MGTFFNQHWLSIILFLIGFPIALWLGNRFGPRKLPRYAYTVQTLNTKIHPAVKVTTTSGLEVTNLHVLRLAFWNAGRREIRSTDIPSKNAPILKLPDGYGSISLSPKQSNPSTQIVIGGRDSDDRGPLIQFDFLNHGDGIAFEALYTSREDSPGEFSVEGSLIGARIVGNRWRRSKDATDTFFITLTFGLLGSSAWYEAVTRWQQPDAASTELVFLFGLSLFLLLLALSGAAQLIERRRVPKWARDFLSQN